LAKLSAYLKRINESSTTHRGEVAVEWMAYATANPMIAMQTDKTSFVFIVFISGRNPNAVVVKIEPENLQVVAAVTLVHSKNSPTPGRSSFFDIPQDH
jgi:hypothetical protein